MSQGSKDQVREAVGIFDTAETMQSAIDELESSGFSRAELSLLASEDAIKDKLGHAYRKNTDLEDNPDAPRVAYVSTETIGDAEGALIGGPLYIAAATAAGIMIASGGPLAATIAAIMIAGGGGAAIGSFFAVVMDKHHADYLQQQLNHGGLVLWVRTRDADHEKRALQILSKHSGHDVHIHGTSDHNA
ncbi:MAG: general stress protein [Rhodospirillales bacterium]|nr:general stress protein [Rhodospirillales bacterium]